MSTTFIMMMNTSKILYQSNKNLFTYHTMFSHDVFRIVRTLWRMGLNNGNFLLQYIIKWNLNVINSTLNILMY